jgi:uncharacterized membrane protein YcaP (DUF421 family)
VAVLSAVSFGYLFVLAKFMGHRQISQLNSFDYITGITLGSIAAELATELESPLRPIVAMTVYGGLTWVVGAVTIRWQRSRKYIEGTPSILFHNGKLYRENLKKAKIDLSEFLGMCRQQGYFDLSQIYTAVFEYNGKLSILPTEANRPLTPQDVGQDPTQATFFTELILDGQVLGENLHRLGKEEVWLDRQLKAQGYHSAQEVFLGLVDQNDNLTLYGAHQ